MAISPAKACKYPHCPALAIDGSYLCDLHKPATKDIRKSSTERGYDCDWRRFRSWFLKKHPLCEDCKLENKYTATEEVHHIKKLRDYPELRLVESNCMSLCSHHHHLRTNHGE